MKRITSISLFISMLLLVQMLSGCSTQLSPSPSPSPSDKTEPTPSLVTSTTEATTISTTPVYTPKPLNGFLVNRYTATDGRYIYYYANDGIHSMDLSGENDQKTKIKSDFNKFIYLGDGGLYYLTNDNNDYMPECENDHGQTFLSFNLMVYDLKTQKISTIHQHVYCAVEAGKKIYMLDHEDHTRILAYDIMKRKDMKVAGSPAEGYHYKDAYLQAIGDKAYLILGEYYLIDNDVIGKEPVKIPDTSEASKFYQIQYSDEGTEILLWNGSEMTNSGIKDIREFFDYGNKLYILTVKQESMNEEGYETDIISLFEVTPNGVVKEAMKTTCTFNGNEVNMYSEMINGWLFCFTIWGFESNDISELVLKQKVY